MKNWYKEARNLSVLDSLHLKTGDQVYVIDDEENVIEFGIVVGMEDDKVYGFWADSASELVSKDGTFQAHDLDIEDRPLSSIAVGRLPKFFIRLIEEDLNDIEGVLKEFPFLERQMKVAMEQFAQSMYNLDITVDPNIGHANGERMWIYDLNAPNLWWGEGKYKSDEGKEGVIQGLPRYNPEYKDNDIGAYYTWWEPYTEPVGFNSLMNLQKAIGGYFYPGKYRSTGRERI